MKIKNVLATAVLAMAGIAASAQAQVAANLSDLILGFRATGGQGQGSNLEVDLGSIALYYGLPAGTHITVSRLSATDLSSIYGSNWNTRTDLSWGIVGAAGRVGSGGPEGQPVNTLWATKAESTAATLSAPWSPAPLSVFSRGSLSNASSVIEPLYLAAPGSLSGKTATSGSAYSANVNATLSGSYTAQDTVQPGTSFGFFNPSIDNTTKIASGSYAVSDLYELQVGASAGTYIGSFGLGADGSLIFSNAPGYFSPSGAPVIATQPSSEAVTSGSSVVFTTSATASGSVTYQWYFNGSAINGATTSRLVVKGATAANAGSYTVVATSAGVSTTSTPAILSFTSTSNPGRLINLSVLSNVQGTLTAGFVIGGSGTSGSENLLIRATGPALAPAPFNVPNVLSDPTLTVNQQSSSTIVATNSGWGTPSSNVATINTADTATGAFALTDSTSKDSALVQSLAVSTGGYTVQVKGASGDSGNALTEVYDYTSNYTVTTPRLVNLSCLTQVNAGGTLTAGFVIGGTTPKTVLVRATGPALAIAPFNVPGTMTDPQIKVQALGSSSILASNAGWGGDAQITAVDSAVGAFALTSTTSLDSAVLLTLAPGPYTAQVTSASGGGGVALVEVYEVP